MPREVLLIDDSKAIHALVRARLTEEPLTLLSAYSGREGLAAARKFTPSLILLDADLPDIDGLEVCRELKADAATANIPVIFLAGAVSPDDRIYGPEVGAADFINKPFNPAELRARVRGALRTRNLMTLVEDGMQIDPVTGLWNRAYFNDRFSQALSMARRHGHPLACVLADIDHFTSINEAYGRGFGDEVLRRTGALLDDVTRAEDLVCRFGPDEFIILCPCTNTAGAETIVARCRHQIGKMDLVCRQKHVPITCSFAVAEDDGRKLSMLETAQRSLNSAKSGVPNRQIAAINGSLAESTQI
jgi:diguanylate cyclase (GGDEF)-like protein